MVPTASSVIDRQDVRFPLPILSQTHITTSRTLKFFQEVVIKVEVLGRLCSVFKDLKPPIAVKLVNPKVYAQKKSRALQLRLKF